MSENIFVPAIIFFSITVISLTSIIIKYKLNVEKIKADTMLKAEEIRARNRLEIEKLVNEDGTNSRSASYDDHFDGLNDEKVDRLKKYI